MEMNPERLLSRRPLDNGLTLEFWDLSRPVAGDRVLVVVEMRVPVPLSAAPLPPDLRPQEDRIIAALGETPVFTKQEVRNFVPAAEVPDLMRQIEEGLFFSLARYLGHPDFPGKFIRKKFAEYQEKRQWG
jgi:hypothetical protein